MRLYDFPLKESNGAWLGLSLASIFISIVTVVAIRYSPSNVSPNWFVSDANKLMALMTAICLFNFFRTIKMPYCRFINMLGATTFGVLLIHANSDAMRDWLWKDLFDNVGHMFVPHFSFRAIGIVFLVFFVCASIDYLRIVFLERPLFALYDKWTTTETGL